MNNISLFLLSAIIWGSTWLTITFQLGVVAPLVSVIYRFGLASLILFGYCWFKKRSFEFSIKVHLWIALQGIFLFGINYWLTYLSITKINSALAAILSTSIVYFNIVFSAIFLGDKLKREVIVGATIGVVGITLIFLPQIDLGNSNKSFWQSDAWSGIALLLLGSIFASLGNIVSAKTQRLNVPVIQANALGMGYASILLLSIAAISGLDFNFDFTFGYVASLVYLALFGSVIAFGAFLTVLGRIGPDKAGYISLVYPVIALVFSTFFENYHWSLSGAIGVLVILLGNFIAMGKYRQFSFFKRMV